LCLVRGHGGAGTGELARVLIAACRPAPLLDTERRDGHLPRMRRQQQIDRQDTILPAAFDDVSGLDENLITADILDRQLVDAAGLADLDAAFGKSLLQSQRNA